MNADDQEPSTSVCSTEELSRAFPARPPAAPGARLAERYRLVRELGEGSFGKVYEAIDERRTDLRVALKLFVARDSRSAARLAREHRVQAEIEHPNIARVHGVASDSYGCFVVTELIEAGDDLLRHVRRPEGSGYDEPRLRASLVQVVRGLAALHRRGKPHGNLKPRNLLVAADGRVVITDVRLERTRAAPDDAGSGATAKDAYMAPEQLSGEAVGRKADLYALGVILFEALTGERPFATSSPEALQERKIREVAPRIEWRLPDAPSDLCELCALLLERNAALRPDAEQTLDRLGEPPRSFIAAPLGSFLGRDNELQLLHDAAQRTRLGAALLVTIRGGAGVGRSALLTRFCEQLQAQPDALALYGRCSTQDSVPFRLFAGAMHALAQYLATTSAFDIASLMPRDAGLLTRLFPTLASVPAIASAQRNSGPSRDEALLRVRAFAALKELLARIADRKLLVLCLDDLHQSDDDSAELMRELLRSPGAPTCLLIGAFRGDTTRERALGALLDSQLPKVELHLEPLMREFSETLAKQLLAHAPRDREASWLVDRAQGNLVALRELALSMRLQEASDGAEAALTRVAGLSNDGRELLELTALTSAPLPANAALALVEGCADALPQLLAASLLRLREHEGRECLEVEDAELQARVLCALDGDRKRTLHASLAHELACDERVAPALIAHHFRAAGLASFATPYTLRAAEHAARSFALAQAIWLYGEALNEAAPCQRVEIERSLSEAYANAGRLAEAAECYGRLLQSATDSDARRELSGHAMTLHLAAGQVERGMALLLALCRDCGVQPPPHSRLGKLLFALTLLRHALGRRMSSLPIPKSSRHDARSRQRIALCFRAMRSLSPWSFEHGAYFAIRAILATRRYRDPQGWPLATSWEVASFSIERGVATPEEDRAMTRAIALAEQHGDEETLALVLVTEGGRAFYVSRFDESLRMFDRAEQVLQSRGRSYSVLFHGTRSGRMAVWLVSGELKRSVDQATEWMNEARALGDHLGVLIMHLMGSLGLLAQDDPRAARESVSQLNSTLGQRTLFVADPWWFGEIALYEGDFARARSAYMDAARSAAYGIMQQSALHRVLCSLYLGRTHLLAAASGSARGLRPVKQQLRRLQREQTPVARAAAAQLRSSLAHLAGDQERALVELERAHAGYTRCGMRLYAAAASQRVGAIRGGEEGAQLIARAHTEASALGVQNPSRWFRSLLPGFGD